MPTLSSFSGTKALRKRVCILSHSIAVKSYQMFSKLDKNTVDQSCKNSSPKRTYFEFKKSQTRFGVLHVKVANWPHNSPHIQSQNSEGFFVKSGIQFPKSLCNATSQVKCTDVEINPVKCGTSSEVN